MADVSVRASRTLAAAPAASFEHVLDADLPTVFGHRFALMPAVVGTDPDHGFSPALGRDRVGTSRIIRCSDGGVLRETLRWIGRPQGFGYQITVLEGPLRHLVHDVTGHWDVAEVPDGSRVTWSWAIRPRGMAGRLAMLGVVPSWRGYAARSLARLAASLPGATGPGLSG